MVNIQAIEKSIMTADEKTLKEMAGNIGMEIYGMLSPEARQRLSGVGTPTQPNHTKTRRARILTPEGRAGTLTLPIIPQRNVPKTEFERMMDEVAAVIVKYGYRNLGFQQTMSGEELLRFIKGRDLIDVVAEFDIEEERYESVMQFENQD